MSLTSSRVIQWIIIILIVILISGGIYHYFNVRAAKLTAPADTVVFITTPGASTWTVPVGVTSVKVEAIGGGGGGGGHYGSGGGGGAYATASNISVTPGSSISVSVGTAGTAGSNASDNATAGGDTTFNTTTVVAKGGARGVRTSLSTTAGGSAAASTPSTGAFSGGGGGAGENGFGSGGGGGGGASKLGAGGNGGTPTNAAGVRGGGGGGSGGGTAGAATGAGGNNDAGAGGGTTVCSNGSSSANHSAGGGGGGPYPYITGCNGGSGEEWDSTHGSGGGGGGGAGTVGGGESAAGAAGNYGGGGGGGGYNSNGGAGAPGLIIITYKATTATMNTSPTTLNTNGLVGYWTFDGKDTVWTSSSAATTLDKSGNNNAGTLTNMNRVTSVTEGKIGQGLKFDGVDDYVNFGNVLSDINSTFTYSFWVYPVPGMAQYNGALFSKAYYPTGFDISISKDGGGSDFRAAGLNVTDSGSNSSALSLNKWSHLVVTYNSSAGSNNFNTYVDGVLATSLTRTGVVGTNANALLLGAETDSNVHWFKGTIDDVRVYNRALSADEVADLYQMGTVTVNASTNALNASGLVGQWSFDGKQTVWTSSSAGTTLDTSGQSNTGTLTNMSQSTSVTEGKIGQALNFSSASQTYIDAGSGASLDNIAPLTVVAWIRPTAVSVSSQNSRIVSKGTSDVLSWRFGYVAGYANQMYFGQSFTGTDAEWWTTSGPITTANIWYHVAVTYDRSATTNDPIFYVNGTPDTTSSLGDPTGSANDDSTVNLLIGGRSGGDRSWEGRIDDLRIYNRILSASEIAALYNQGR